MNWLIVNLQWRKKLTVHPSTLHSGEVLNKYLLSVMSSNNAAFHYFQYFPYPPLSH